MKRLKRMIMILFCICLLSMLGGCSTIGKENYYETKEEAREMLLEYLEEKYQKEFTLTGKESYKYVEAEDGYVYRGRFQDKEGLEASGILAQRSFMERMKGAISSAIPTKGDTYSAVFYTQKAIREIEPLFEDESFERYIISLNNPGHAEENLSLTLDEFFEGSEVYYWLDVVLPDGQTEEEYAQIIYDFYQKLTTEQSLAFSLSVYTNGVLIYSTSYFNEEGFYGEQSFDDVMEGINIESSHSIPDDRWLVWDDRIKEEYSWDYEEEW